MSDRAQTIIDPHLRSNSVARPALLPRIGDQFLIPVLNPGLLSRLHTAAYRPEDIL